MLPFHRRRERGREERVNQKWDATSPSTTEPKSKRFGRFVLDWIRVSWKDVLALAILGAASQAIYSAPVVSVRTFPITFTQSGDIVYPQFAYPYRGWIISPMASGLISVLIPIGIIALAQIRIRSFWDMNNGILGVLYAVVIGTLFQVIIKTLIGGFRPYWLDVCKPDISRAASHNTTQLNGVGFQQIMYTVDVCTNPDENALKTAMSSFPSGHSTAAFAGYVFLFLWMNAKLKVWANYRSSFYWLALLFAPILGATLMACALTIDQAHNWYDILVGSLIGTVSAFAAYRCLYAAVWDWRYNHIPLKNREALDYAAAALAPEYMERAVWVRKLGWGRRKKVRSSAPASGAGLGRSPRSSTAYATRHARMPSPRQAQPGVAYPDSAHGRVSGQHARSVRGEEMV
ncbi:lipid phosphate phosphatase 1 [Rhypophila decipiens]|uniref:Lipid phosphate phosphatase 1 n=1 Tax=Rhypophila decipiens TaxID=261697 RepID=A0AAN6YC09_9PEZI|nr:lipid phosphate phosphatase 1 [Rhypophila decipiens]